ncbi:MAG: hypothetical protein Q9220_006866 [cf. Caloplaca sp. 1 TL-2023]
MAQLEALTSICILLSSRNTGNPEWIREHFQNVLQDKIQLHGQGTGRQHEVEHAAAKFKCGLADVAFNTGQLDASAYELEIAKAYKNFTKFKSDPQALCDRADAEIAFTSNFQRSSTQIGGDTAKMNIVCWKHLTEALYSLTVAATLPDAKNLPRIHLRRGDCELFRRRLGFVPWSYDLAAKSRVTLTKNAEIYYREALRLAKAGSTEEEAEALVKQVTAASLSDHLGNPQFYGALPRRKIDEIMEDMIDEGLIWSRGARGHEVKILTRDSGVVQLDGFEAEEYERVQKIFKLFYGLNLEHKDHALKGWNWGKGEFGKAELAFNVQNRPAFEIPYSEISNTNLAGKNEVAVEFSLPAGGNETGTNGHLGGARSRGRKSGAGKDQLVEMRFYIPGTATKKENDEDGEDKSGEGSEAEEQHNAANLFYETLMDKAEIGEVAGDTFATFLEVLHLTPRGRFGIDMYETSFRLRGKTYDYKIPYENIKKFMLLPKPDDLHTLITIGLDPPLRQGQTRYPFLVMQFKREEEVTIELNMTKELLEGKYKGKLNARYEQPQHTVVAQVFRGLAGKKIVTPSKDFVSHHQQSGVKCSIKANEGHLYCLDKSFMFVPKPATYIPFDNISVIVMSRVGGAVSASRTFDITITMKNGAGENQFSNINREEQKPLEEFFQAKGLRTKNEMLDDSSALIAAALKDADMASSDEEVVAARADRGSADEDEESIDEDFKTDSESDVAEEFDSAHESSGSGSDEEMADGDAGGDSDPPEKEAEARPKKKAKTSK